MEPNDSGKNITGIKVQLAQDKTREHVANVIQLLEAIAEVPTQVATAVLSALKGAVADPTKIGKEFMPAVLDLDTIFMNDAGEAIFTEAGMLLRNHNSLAFSDGETPGGLIIQDESRLFGATVINQSEYATTNVRKQLGSVWIPASAVVPATHLIIRGSLSIRINGAGTPSDGTILGFVTSDRLDISEQTVGATFGISLNGLNQHLIIPNYIGALRLDTNPDDATKLTIADPTISLPTGVALGIDRITDAASQFTGDSTMTDYSWVAEPPEYSTIEPGNGFYLHFVCDVPASSGPSLLIGIFYDLTIRAQ